MWTEFKNSVQNAVQNFIPSKLQKEEHKTSMGKGESAENDRKEEKNAQTSQKDKQAGDEVVAQLAEVKGEILAPWQPWMPVQAGKKASISLIALWDIDHDGGPLQEEAAVIEESIKRHHWGAVLTAKSELKRGLRQHYKRAPFNRPTGKALYPKTGWRVRPHSLWIPQSEK